VRSMTRSAGSKEDYDVEPIEPIKTDVKKTRKVATTLM